MQREGSGRDGFFGFGGLFPGFGGPMQPGSLISSFFGGGNPFDDPFFTNPFDAMMGPSLFQQRIFGSNMLGQPHRDLGGAVNNAGGLFQQSIFGSNMHGLPHRDLGEAVNNAGGLFQQSILGSNMFGRPHRDLCGAVNNAGGIFQQAAEPSRPRGPIIKELSSDDEDAAGVNEDEKNIGDPRKHPRMSKKSHVEDPDEEARDNKRPRHEQLGREDGRASTSHLHLQALMSQNSTVTYGGPNGACCTSLTRRIGGDGARPSTSRPQPRTFRFESSTVTYPNGACYASSTTRNTRGNVVLEERKEADTTTGKATHRISRGIGDKGHSFTRNLNRDGNINTMQTLHNLNEDELTGFEESWQKHAGQNFHGWDHRMNMPGSGNVRADVGDENEMLALPAPDQLRGTNLSRMKTPSRNGSSSSRMKMPAQNGPAACSRHARVPPF